MVNVSSFVSVRSLHKCSEELQKRFRSEDISEDELTALMTRFVELAKNGQHKEAGWPETAYGVSKIGVTVQHGNFDQHLRRVWLTCSEN